MKANYISVDKRMGCLPIPMWMVLGGYRSCSFLTNFVYDIVLFCGIQISQCICALKWSDITSSIRGYCQNGKSFGKALSKYRRTNPPSFNVLHIYIFVIIVPLTQNAALVRWNGRPTGSEGRGTWGESARGWYCFTLEHNVCMQHFINRKKMYKWCKKNDWLTGCSWE